MQILKFILFIFSSRFGPGAFAEAWAEGFCRGLLPGAWPGVFAEGLDQGFSPRVFARGLAGVLQVI